MSWQEKLGATPLFPKGSATRKGDQWWAFQIEGTATLRPGGDSSLN